MSTTFINLSTTQSQCEHWLGEFLQSQHQHHLRCIPPVKMDKKSEKSGYLVHKKGVCVQKKDIMQDRIFVIGLNGMLLTPASSREFHLFLPESGPAVLCVTLPLLKVVLQAEEHRFHKEHILHR